MPGIDRTEDHRLIPPDGPTSAEQTAQRAQDVAVERALDVAEQLERLAGVAEERAQGPGELGPDEAEQQDPDVQQAHARRPVASGGLRCIAWRGVWFSLARRSGSAPLVRGWAAGSAAPPTVAETSSRCRQRRRDDDLVGDHRLDDDVLR